VQFSQTDFESHLNLPLVFLHYSLYAGEVSLQALDSLIFKSEIKLNSFYSVFDLIAVIELEVNLNAFQQE